jgi:hypothetical protein
MTTARNVILLGVLIASWAGVCVAQYQFGGGRSRLETRGDDGDMVRLEGGGSINQETVRTARETVSHSTGTPNWTNPPGFEKDVFTFTRVIYKPSTRSRGFRGSRMGWINDYPDSDLNLSFRLQQLTATKVDPDGRVLKLTDPALCDYPFMYMVKPGRAEFREEEVPHLRKYLLNGGALLADDFWGTQEWDSFEHEMKRVLPERDWVELPMTHPLFHCVFDLNRAKNSLQVPSIHFFERTGETSRNGVDSKDVHIRAWLDDRQRIMVLAAHNTDNGDGWEREGEDATYFREFSEPLAYPLAINIIFYLMTH